MGESGTAERARDALAQAFPDALAARIPAGERLVPWVAAAPEELVEALVSLSGPDLEHLTRALGRLGTNAVELIVRAEERAVNRGAQKILRRAVHRLRSQGVEVRLARPERHTGTLPPIEIEEVAEGFVGPIDPEGHRILVLVLPGRTRSRAVRLHRLLASDETGIVRVDSFEGGRSQARGLVRELQARTGGKLVPAPVEAVRELARRSLRLGSPDDGPDAETLRDDLGALGEGSTPGELMRRRCEVTLGTRRATDEILRRIEEGRVPPWVPRGDAVRDLVQELSKMGQSRILLTPAQQQVRRNELIEAGLARVFGDDVRERFATRLEETAYLLGEQGDSEGAGAALAVADELRAAGEPGSVPLLRRLLEISLRAVSKELRDEDRGRLILP
ncbi:MAG: hypothetical protein V3T14_06285 [Myxococcota bacterium]